MSSSGSIFSGLSGKNNFHLVAFQSNGTRNRHTKYIRNKRFENRCITIILRHKISCMMRMTKLLRVFDCQKSNELPLKFFFSTHQIADL